MARRARRGRAGAGGAAALCLVAACQPVPGGPEAAAPPAIAAEEQAARATPDGAPAAQDLAEAPSAAEEQLSSDPEVEAWFNASPAEMARRLQALGARLETDPSAPASAAPDDRAAAAGAEAAPGATPLRATLDAPPAPPGAVEDGPRVVHSRIEEEILPLSPEREGEEQAPGAQVVAAPPAAPPGAAPQGPAGPSADPSAAPDGPPDADPASAESASQDGAPAAGADPAAAAPDAAAPDTAPVPTDLAPVPRFTHNLARDPRIVAGPAEGGSWGDLGVRLLAVRAWDPALSAFRKAVALEGLTERSLLGAVAATRGLGRRRQAVAMLERAVRRWPDSAMIRNNYGVVLHESGRLPEAEREFRTARRILDRGGAGGPRLSAEVARNLDILHFEMERDAIRLGRPELRPQGRAGKDDAVAPAVAPAVALAPDAAPEGPAAEAAPAGSAPAKPDPAAQAQPDPAAPPRKAAAADPAAAEEDAAENAAAEVAEDVSAETAAAQNARDAVDTTIETAAGTAADTPPAAAPVE